MPVTDSDYPNSLDTLANPTTSTLRNDPGYELDEVISRVQDILEALEYRVGAVATQGTEAKYGLAGDANGASSWEPVSRQNELLNGRFDHWPQGTSFTSDGYTADGWYAKKGAGGSPAFTVSQQAHTLNDVIGEPQYALRFAQTTQATGTVPTLEQPRYGVRRLAGKQVTLSFWAVCTSGTVVITPRFRQNFGSGGSPSSEVDTDGSTITVTTTRQRFVRTITVPTIAGKTIGSTANTDYISCQLRFPLSSTYTVDIDQIKLEVGATASDFQYDLEADKRSLLHYFERFNSQGVNAVWINTFASGTTFVRFQLPITRKYKSATITGSAESHWDVTLPDGSGAQTGTIIAGTAGGAAPDGYLRGSVTGLTGLTTGANYTIRWANANAYMDVDARITP